MLPSNNQLERWQRRARDLCRYERLHPEGTVRLTRLVVLLSSLTIFFLMSLNQPCPSTTHQFCLKPRQHVAHEAMTSQASSKFQLIDFYQMGGNMPEEVHGGHGSILLNLWAARRKNDSIFGHKISGHGWIRVFECMALNFWSPYFCMSEMGYQWMGLAMDPHI